MKKMPDITSLLDASAGKTKYLHKIDLETIAKRTLKKYARELLIFTFYERS
jgi:hypothetical protein